MGKKQSRKAPPEDANSGNPSSGAVGRRKKGGDMEEKKLKLVVLLVGVLAVMVGVGIYYGETQEVKREKEEVLKEGVVQKTEIDDVGFVNGATQRHHGETSEKYVRAGWIFRVNYLGDYEMGDEYVEFVGSYQEESLKVKVKVGPLLYRESEEVDGFQTWIGKESFLNLLPGEYRLRVMYVPEKYKTDNESERDWCSEQSGGVVYCEWVRSGFGNEKIDFLSYMRNEADKGEIVIEGEKLIPLRIEGVE